MLKKKIPTTLIPVCTILQSDIDNNQDWEDEIKKVRLEFMVAGMETINLIHQSNSHEKTARQCLIFKETLGKVNQLKQEMGAIQLYYN